MKSHTFHPTALAVALAATGLLLSAAPSRAAVVATAGDLILAFRTSDNSVASDLEVDLNSTIGGSATDFEAFATNNPGGVLNLNLNGTYYGANGGLSALDLKAVFGDNWATLPNLVWSVAGQTGAASNQTLYVTSPSGFNRASGATQSGPGNKLQVIRQSLSGQASLTSPQAANVAVNLGSQNNYSGAIRGTGFTKDYNYFSATTEAAYPATASVSLPFYKSAPGTGPAQLLGNFTLETDGTFFFTAAPVPEPSSTALFAISGLVVTASVRRRRARLLC